MPSRAVLKCRDAGTLLLVNSRWHRVKVVLWIAIGGSLFGACVHRLAQQEPPLPDHRKKILEWGFDEPTPRFMRDAIAKMEEQPFDGLVFRLLTPANESFCYGFWGDKRHSLKDYEQTIIDLKETKFKKFTELFFRLDLHGKSFDWFSDEAWEKVLHNTEVAAQIAQRANLKGFLLDTEQYFPTTILGYASQPQYKKKSFAEFEAQLRRRGKEWIQRINRHLPAATILLTFGYEQAQPLPKHKDRSESTYGLLPAFLDGMLEGATPQTSLVNAGEPAYSFKHDYQFVNHHRFVESLALNRTALPEKYKVHFSAGFGLWLDHRWRDKGGWHTEDVSKNYFSPETFANSLRAGLTRTDKYVWIYTEVPNWWTNEKIPKDYLRTIREVRTEFGMLP